MELLSVIAVAIVVLAVVDGIALNRVRRVPGYLRLPFVGDLFLLAWHFYGFFDFVTDVFRRHGTGAFCMFIGRIRCWGIVEPKDVEHVLKGNWKNYPVSKGLRGTCLADLFGDGIFHADGDSWYQQRKTVSKEFTANNFKDYMLREFSRYADVLQRRLLATAPNTPVDMHAMYFKLTLDSFGKVAFGVDLGGLAGSPQPFAAAFDTAQDISAWRVARKPPFWWKTERFLNIGSERVMSRCLATINQFVQQLINGRTAAVAAAEGEERQDLFSRLFAISGSEQDPHKRLKYLRDMTVNFLIAGRDTTACGLSWLTYEVCKHPAVEARLVEELHDLITTEAPNYDDLQACQYLTAVIHETLRLHPSVPFDVKHVDADDVLPSGVKVQAGDAISYIPYAMGRLPAIWGPGAEEFRPERWLDAEGRFTREDPFKYPVFQAGPRLCLGVDMAVLEMKAVVAVLYRRLRFTVLREPHYRSGIVLQMVPPGLLCDVSPR